MDNSKYVKRNQLGVDVSSRRELDEFLTESKKTYSVEQIIGKLTDMYAKEIDFDIDFEAGMATAILHELLGLTVGYNSEIIDKTKEHIRRLLKRQYTTTGMVVPYSRDFLKAESSKDDYVMVALQFKKMMWKGRVMIALPLDMLWMDNILKMFCTMFTDDMVWANVGTKYDWVFTVPNRVKSIENWYIDLRDGGRCKLIGDSLQYKEFVFDMMEKCGLKRIYSVLNASVNTYNATATRNEMLGYKWSCNNNTVNGIELTDKAKELISAYKE